MNLVLKNGYTIEIVRDMGIGDLVTEVTGSSVIGELAANLTDENLSTVTLGGTDYSGLTCAGINAVATKKGFDVHINLREKTSANSADEILNILMGEE